MNNSKIQPLSLSLSFFLLERTNLLPVLPLVNSHRASQNVVFGRRPPAFGGFSSRSPDSPFQSLRQNLFQRRRRFFLVVSQHHHLLLLSTRFYRDVVVFLFFFFFFLSRLCRLVLVEVLRRALRRREFYVFRLFARPHQCVLLLLLTAKRSRHFLKCVRRCFPFFFPLLFFFFCSSLLCLLFFGQTFSRVVSLKSVGTKNTHTHTHTSFNSYFFFFFFFFFFFCLAFFFSLSLSLSVCLSRLIHR